MKKALWAILIVIVLASVIFGIWGYFIAKDIKTQGKEIEQLTNDTLELKTITMNENSVQLEHWQNLSDKSSSILNEMEKYSVISDTLKKNTSEYYGVQAQDRYKEAQYLHFLNEAQGSLDLKSTQSKSKGQIETIAKYYDDLIISGNDLSLGPKFDGSRHKVEQEAEAFRENLNNIVVQMNNESPPVRLRTADLDKAIDELKQEIIQSLNDWVDLQNNIREEIANMGKTNWIMPF